MTCFVGASKRVRYNFQLFGTRRTLGFRVISNVAKLKFILRLIYNTVLQDNLILLILNIWTPVDALRTVNFDPSSMEVNEAADYEYL